MWNDTACASCADNQIITDGICTDCPPDAEGVDGVCKCTQSGFELVGGVCSCTDEYTLLMKDSYGDGWESNGLQLQANFTNGESLKYYLDSGSTASFNLCQIVTLEVSQEPGSGSWDHSEASYSLIRGEETIFESVANSTRPHTTGVVWANCPDGQVWNDTACVSCADNQIITDDICTDCSLGEEVEGNECVCNGDAYTLLMEDRYSDGWDTDGLQLQATFTNGESLQSLGSGTRTASVNLCQIVTLEVSRAPGNHDNNEAVILLFVATKLYLRALHLTFMVLYGRIVLMDKGGQVQHAILVQIIKL